MGDAVVGALAIGGALLILLAGVGVLRFPDIYSRMHAATKASTLGIILVAIAGAIVLEGGRGKIFAAAIFIFITAPSSAHFIGRAAYRAEGIDIHLDGPDDLQSLLDDPPDDRS